MSRKTSSITEEAFEWADELVFFEASSPSLMSTTESESLTVYPLRRRGSFSELSWRDYRRGGLRKTMRRLFSCFSICVTLKSRDCDEFYHNDDTWRDLELNLY
ncbi:hypothetical protein F2Q70_00032666 [Brassica cretica]|uniref:Uncharacterized protein n=1 Tax=Brassica cretica TaxID=69181 RepID=A0A8S9FIQ7_BRACR|nr:hypothetical protein F2Q70_00032666 [Brassica cretica]